MLDSNAIICFLYIHEKGTLTKNACIGVVDVSHHAVVVGSNNTMRARVTRIRTKNTDIMRLNVYTYTYACRTNLEVLQ